MSAEPVEMDKQGRVLIPPFLRESVGLEKEVVVSGDGRKLTIWNRGDWDRENEAIRAEFREIKNNLAKFPRDRLRWLSCINPSWWTR